MAARGRGGLGTRVPLHRGFDGLRADIFAVSKLFNHLVGERQQFLGEFYANCFGGLEIKY